MLSENRIYLLYPPISKLERYSSAIGNAGGEQIPLGIFYLAAVLRESDFEVKLTDAEALKLSTQQIVEEVKVYSPKYVGISSSTVAFHRAVEVAKAIRESIPGITIILGGPHVTSNPTHAMQTGLFDFGVLHEGEITLVELLQTLNARGDVGRIKGVAFLDDSKGLVLTEQREYIENLDSLPFPAYDLIPDITLYTPPPSNYKTLPVINIITSRGCPNQCTFCDSSIFGRRYRKRSAENIAEEIRLLKDTYGVREIAFVDDTLLIDKDRIYRLFEILDRDNLSFYWTCMSRINTAEWGFLKFLKSKGCWHISFGIESGDEDILKVIKKNISLERAREVISWCRQLKIRTKGFFMLGHPTDTLDTIDKTIELACQLKLDDIVVTLNTPIPGSQQFAEAERYGTIDKTDWSQYNYWRPVFVPDGLTKEILVKKHREFYRRFYLRPHILFRYALSFVGKGGLRRFRMVFGASAFLLRQGSPPRGVKGPARSAQY